MTTIPDSTIARASGKCIARYAGKLRRRGNPGLAEQFEEFAMELSFGPPSCMWPHWLAQYPAVVRACESIGGEMAQVMKNLKEGKETD